MLRTPWILWWLCLIPAVCVLRGLVSSERCWHFPDLKSWIFNTSLLWWIRKFSGCQSCCFFLCLKDGPQTIANASSSSAMFIYTELTFDLESSREISHLNAQEFVTVYQTLGHKSSYSNGFFIIMCEVCQVWKNQQTIAVLTRCELHFILYGLVHHETNLGWSLQNSNKATYKVILIF